MTPRAARSQRGSSGVDAAQRHATVLGFHAAIWHILSPPLTYTTTDNLSLGFDLLTQPLCDTSARELLHCRLVQASGAGLTLALIP